MRAQAGVRTFSCFLTTRTFLRHSYSGNRQVEYNEYNCIQMISDAFFIAGTLEHCRKTLSIQSENPTSDFFLSICLLRINDCNCRTASVPLRLRALYAVYFGIFGRSNAFPRSIIISSIFNDQLCEMVRIFQKSLTLVRFSISSRREFLVLLK